MFQSNYCEEATREEFPSAVKTQLTAEGDAAPFRNIQFQPITHPEAERIFAEVKKGRIEGVSARDAAFFVFAHMKTNAGAAFSYTLTKAGGESYAFKTAGEALAVLQIVSVLEDAGARFGVTVGEASK